MCVMNEICQKIPIIEQWLPYEHKLDLRALEQIDLVVIHCTELPDLAMAREFGEKSLYPSGTGNSGHFYIDRDGAIYAYIKAERIANHTRGYNPRSIGIEIVNRGRYPDWFHSQQQQMKEPYTAEQICAVISLLQKLKAQLPKLTWIAGHEDLDTAQVMASDDPSTLVYRKRDPGPLFPWQTVLQQCGLFYLNP